MSSLIIELILVELGIAIGGIFLVKQLQKKKTRQPQLSNKIIKNLKF